MIIDTHMHIIEPLDERLREYIDTMKNHGVDRAFFISWGYEDIPSYRQYGMSLEYSLDIMSTFPQRFYWFPCYVNPTVGNYLSVVRENLKIGAAGTKLPLSWWGELPDDKRLLPIYDLAEEYGAQIIIDTSYWYLAKEEPLQLRHRYPIFRKAADRIKDYQDYLSHLRPIVESHPDVNFQLAHAGARNFVPENAREVGEFIHEHRNVYADLAALIMNPAQPHQFLLSLKILVETAGEDRIMFGTDWPHYARGENMYRAIEVIRRDENLSLKARKMILGDNALRFVRGRQPGLK